MKQEFNGVVGPSAGRDLIVVQMAEPLRHDGYELVRAYRTAPNDGRQAVLQVVLALKLSVRRDTRE